MRCVRLALDLPDGWIVRELGKQLLRAGCGVGANYRAASRAQSTRDLISKLKKVEEEADETAFWIEQPLIVALPANLAARAKRIAPLSDEVLALVATAIKTCRVRLKASRRKLS
jgi:four helix bundle protein